MRTGLIALTALTLAGCQAGERAPAAGSDTAAAAPATAAGLDTVVLETTRGRIVLELDAGRAPETVTNFLNHVRSGFYDGLIFHRIEQGFVIQAGAVTESGAQRKSSVFPIRNEAQNGLHNVRGTVGMARTGDPHSATSEFFINLADNSGKLDFREATLRGWGYAVFGRVIEGMDVVDRIAATPTTRRGMYGTYPTEPTVIGSARAGGAPASAP